MTRRKPREATRIETVEYKLGEADYFLEKMREHHARIVETIRHAPEIMPRPEDFLAFKYVLSAFLAAATTLEGYLYGALRRRYHPWLAGKLDNPLFHAFRHARNFEQHQETVTISRADVAGIFGPEDPHLALAFHFLGVPMDGLKLHYSTDPLVALSAEYLNTWAQIVKEALASHYFKVIP